ncbi:hypothetical protein BN1723_018652, partial [Verticillium longisporum]
KPVDVKHIHNFKRMRCYPNYATLVSALKESSVLEVIGEEGEEQVKRKEPYKLTVDKNDVTKRAVYVKGFGDETPKTQFDLEDFFTEHGGDVAA